MQHAIMLFSGNVVCILLKLCVFSFYTRTNTNQDCIALYYFLIRVYTPHSSTMNELFISIVDWSIRRQQSMIWTSTDSTTQGTVYEQLVRLHMDKLALGYWCTVTTTVSNFVTAYPIHILLLDKKPGGEEVQCTGCRPGEDIHKHIKSRFKPVINTNKEACTVQTTLVFGKQTIRFDFVLLYEHSRSMICLYMASLIVGNQVS